MIYFIYSDIKLLSISEVELFTVHATLCLFFIIMNICNQRRMCHLKTSNQLGRKTYYRLQDFTSSVGYCFKSFNKNVLLIKLTFSVFFQIHPYELASNSCKIFFTAHLWNIDDRLDRVLQEENTILEQIT